MNKQHKAAEKNGPAQWASPRKETEGMKKDEEDWIDRFDRRVIEFLWTIFISMITAIITTILVTRLGVL